MKSRIESRKSSGASQTNRGVLASKAKFSTNNTGVPSALIQKKSP